MNKEKVELNLGNFIVRSGNDGFSYYRVTTANPMIEFKVYSETLLYKLLDEAIADKSDENIDLVKFQLIAMFYVCTANDSNMMGLVYQYINYISENVEKTDDISITQARAAYYVKDILKKMAENKFKVK